MHIPKEFFQDKLALILSGLTIITTIVAVTLILIRGLGDSDTSNFIVSYRHNLGIEAFQSGGLSSFIVLIIFSIAVVTLSIILCWRVYLINHKLAIGVLLGGLFLSLLTLVVSNSLLALH